MRPTLIALALAAMLAIGTGGVAAAGASSGNTPAEQLPDDYTVDAHDPFDRLSPDEVEEAVETAYANERVQRYVDDTDDVHFRVVAGTEQVEVQVAPGPDAEERIVAEIGPDGTVTEVFEPTVTSDESETDTRTVERVDESQLSSDDVVLIESINESQLSSDTVSRVESTEYDEKLPAEQSKTMQVDSDGMTLVENGWSVAWKNAENSGTLAVELIDQTAAGDVVFNLTADE